MERKQKFRQEILDGYKLKGDGIVLGGAMLDEETLQDSFVTIPLKTLNRHGLIAGATGTGKTKTLQGFAERLSEKGVPVLLMDIKGDLSGLAKPGKHHPKIDERHEKIGLPYSPNGFPVEFLTLSEGKGARLRATVSEFGPVLFSKVLNLNDTQSGIVSIVFKYCDDNSMPLLDLKDFKKVLQFIANEGREEMEKQYGNLSRTSVNTILRKTIELEQQDAELFFGEKSFEIDDLLTTDDEGFGKLFILRLSDIQDRPKLFSTFMLSLLAEAYSSLPEAGDLDKPKLVIFIDEAHLIFDKASDALLDQIETIIKLIRSKGVGIFFCTQNPTDVPDAVLSQLGLKVQHALRAFTAKDRKMIRLTAENYPLSEYYKTDKLLTSLGIGEAAITALNEKGIPTPLVATMLQAPKSRMDILTQAEIDDIVGKSRLTAKYAKAVDRESAYEMLSEKLNVFRDDELQRERQEELEKLKTASQVKPVKGAFESILDSTLTKQMGRTVARELTRGLLGVLGLGGSTRKSRKTTRRKKSRR